MKEILKKKIAVGMSGGVDSTVSALLLKEAGHDVIGVTMKLWDGDDRAPISGSCYSKSQDKIIEEAKKCANEIGIEYHAIDCVKEFKKNVIEYVISSYKNGLTPNPCVACNELVKFGALFDGVKDILGSDFYFSTGHYARVEYDEKTNRYLLKRGKNYAKDQSYFLYRLPQRVLSKLIFPLEGMEKSEVRETARTRGLSVADKSDSQDFFAGEYHKLFEDSAQIGNIVDKYGNILGSHNGIFNYTIGQRKGLDIAHKHALYVLEIDSVNNAIIVGEKGDMVSAECFVKNINYIAAGYDEKAFEALVKTRSAHKGTMALVTPLNDRTACIKFNEETGIVSKGQSAVFYDGDIVIGGGVIC